MDQFGRRATFNAVALALLMTLLIQGGLGGGSAESAASAEAAAPGTFDVTAEEAILVDAATGQTLFAKNEHQQVPPASIVKVMTMLLAFEAVENGQASWDDTVRVSRGAESMGGSQVYLATGEQFSLELMMHAIAIQSANDAAYAVAEHISGSVPAFVDRMNRRSAALGMTESHFATPHGLPIDQISDAGARGELKGDYSTAHDISLMAREVLKHPHVLDWSSTWIAPFREGGTQLYNTNRLIREYEGADGLKTGHTAAAGFSLVATAERDERRLIAVLMGMDSDEERVEQASRLLDYGFLNFEQTTVAATGETVGDARLRDAVPERFPVTVAEPFTVLVPRGGDADVVREIRVREGLKAPIDKGEVVGEIVASVDGTTLLTAPVVSADDVKRANFFVRAYRAVRDWILSFF